MATLVYSDVDGIDRSFALGAEPVMVGRAAECAIRSDDPRVSRVHARFFVDGGTLWVEDLGSSNGIYVGPHKVQRAQVPIGEIVLVGSLMIRLLPASGTLPPPNGLHGTLAQWLELERKARAAVEDERDAFARRVGELHEELRQHQDVGGAHADDASALREQLDDLRRTSAADLEQLRAEVAKAREAKMIAETQAGIATAEKLAEADMQISALQREVDALKRNAVAPPQPPGAELVAALTARAEKAEKEVAAAQIRAQGAERNYAHAQTQVAKAETRVSEIEQRIAEAVAARGAAESELAALREKATALESRLGAGDAPLQAAEARAAKLAADLADAQHQLDARRERASELEQAVATANAAAAAAEAKLAAVRGEASAAADRQKAAEARATDLDERLRKLASAEQEIAAARKMREDARARSQTADVQIAEAVARADEFEKRASAADTMAKAMAKDVAEALRRAVEADKQTRAVARELDGARKAAEAAQGRDGERAAAIRDAEVRAEAAASKAAAVEAELRAKLDAAQHQIEQTQRELAAERSTAMSLVDRKTQLERELSEARTQLAGVQHRVELAEGRTAELEVQIEQLEEKIQDLEAGAAVEQTASSATLDEARGRLGRLEEQLGEAKAAAKTAVKTAAELEKRVDGLEQQLAATKQARSAAEGELASARARLAELERTAEEHTGSSEAERARLADAERRAEDAESRLAPLAAKADAADLAIGRAGALQRQLDEALQKLSWFERDAAAGKIARPGTGEDLGERLQAVEARARDAETRAQQSEEHATELEHRASESSRRADELELRARELEAHVREVEARSRDIEARAKDIEARAKDAAERIVDAERRAREAQSANEELERRLLEVEASAHTPDPLVERRLAEAHQQIAQLKREVDAAENVRQFAANTEREIAQLERDLREAKAKLAQVTLERDRMESQLRDVRDDSETTHHRRPSRPPVVDPEQTAQADLSRYTALVARAAELEQKLVKLEKDDEKLRRALADTEAQLAAARRAQEDEPTNTGKGSPEVVEHLSVLEESIDSLRANMRAASDETAMMEQSESVIVVATAVSSAAEHVERARDALRALTALVEK